MAKGIAWTLGAVFLTLINITTAAFNYSTSSNAAVAGMDRSSLYRDRDFRFAVGDVVEQDCKVSGDKIKC